MRYILTCFLYVTFWVALHLGITLLFTELPKGLRKRIFNSKNKFFKVSKKEMRFYKKIRLPKWKDKLPQFNPRFNKKELPETVTDEYIEEFIYVTCKAESIHYTAIVLGYLSIFLTTLTPNVELWLAVHTFFGFVCLFCNLPFSMIQRYNRHRLLSFLRAKQKRSVSQADVFLRLEKEQQAV